MDKLFNIALTIRAQDSPNERGSGLAGPDTGVRQAHTRAMRHMVSCLLIDKNAGERHRLSAFMAELGFLCTEVPAAEDGIRFCQDHSPDVVVMEASALTDAREFLRLTSFAGKRTGRPVVILYAENPDFETMGESILEGAAEFLLKPFDRDLLKFKLRQSGILSASGTTH